MSFNAPIPEYASLSYLFNRWGIEPDEDYLFQLSEMDGLEFYYKHFNDGEFELYSADFNEPPLVKYELDQLRGVSPKDLAGMGFTEFVIERDYQYFKTDVGFAWGMVETTPFFHGGKKIYAFYEDQDHEAKLNLKYPYANYNEVFLHKDSVIKLESSQSLIKEPSTKIYITDLLQRWFTDEQLYRKEGTGSAFDLLEDFLNRLGLKLYIHNDELEPYWAFKDDLFQKQKPFFPNGEYLIKKAYCHFYGGDFFNIEVTTVCYSKDDSQEEILVMGNKGKYSKSIYAYSDDIKAFEQEHGINKNIDTRATDQPTNAPTLEELYPNFPPSGNDNNIYVKPILERYIAEYGERPKPKKLWLMMLEDQAIQANFTVIKEKDNELIRGFNGNERFTKNNSDDNHRNWQKQNNYKKTGIIPSYSEISN